MKEVLILLAHGSSDIEWAAPFFGMTKAVRDKHKNVRLAFMELSDPSLESVVEVAVSEGAEQIKVLPLFLAKGRHLKQDVPNMLKRYEEKWQIETEMLDHIGLHPALSDTISTIIEETL